MHRLPSFSSSFCFFLILVVLLLFPLSFPLSFLPFPFLLPLPFVPTSRPVGANHELHLGPREVGPPLCSPDWGTQTPFVAAVARSSASARKEAAGGRAVCEEGDDAVEAEAVGKCEGGRGGGGRGEGGGGGRSRRLHRSKDSIRSAGAAPARTLRARSGKGLMALGRGWLGRGRR